MTSHRQTTYEGRPLPSPDDDLADQGLQFDLGTLAARRSVLQVMGLGVLSLGLAACSGSGDSSSSTTATTSTGSGAPSDLIEIPDETAGPYPGDGSNGADVLDQSGVVRSDIRSSFGGGSATAEGVPMTFSLTLYDMANKNSAYAGLAVYAWHCDRDGAYSLYSEGLTNETYLRGVQISDADGKVTFTSIFPACYTGRWPHIHFEVYPNQASITDAANAIATSQVALPQDVCETVYAQTGYDKSVSNLAQVSLSSDNVFGNDSAAHQIATVTGDLTAGYIVTLPVGIDTTTDATGEQPSGDGAPSGTPPTSGAGPAAPTTTG